MAKPNDPIPEVSEVEYLKSVINDLVRDMNWIYREPKLIGPITLNAILHVHEVKAWTVAKDALESYVRHTQAWKAYQIDKLGLEVVKGEENVDAVEQVSEVQRDDSGSELGVASESRILLTDR